MTFILVQVFLYLLLCSCRELHFPACRWCFLSQSNNSLLKKLYQPEKPIRQGRDKRYQSSLLNDDYLPIGYWKIGSFAVWILLNHAAARPSVVLQPPSVIHWFLDIWLTVVNDGQCPSPVPPTWILVGVTAGNPKPTMASCHGQWTWPPVIMLKPSVHHQLTTNHPSTLTITPCQSHHELMTRI